MIHSTASETSRNAWSRLGADQAMPLLVGLLVVLVATGCQLTRQRTPAAVAPAATNIVDKADALTNSPVVKWLENEVLVESMIARVAAGCNAVATGGAPPAAQREALRLKAAFATAAYSIMSGRNPLVQVLDLVATAELMYQVWLVGGRAASEFGSLSRPVELAVTEIRSRTREHALANISADELNHIEDLVRTWRNSHPDATVVEFIRFEAFADEFAREMGVHPDLGGMLGRIEGQAISLEALGERALILVSRMPRLAEWHAEAAAANILARPDLADALAALKRLDELQQTLPKRLESLDAVDDRLAAMPAELADAVARQPELKKAFADLEQTGERLKSLDASVGGLEEAVSTLSRQLGQLNSTATPASVELLADKASAVLMRRARSLLLLGTGCAVAVVGLLALLRRRRSETAPQC